MQKNEITKDRYDYAFECMPPIFVSHMNGKPVKHGFASSEPYTHNTYGAVCSVYWKEDERHYTSLCNLVAQDGNRVHYTELFVYRTCKAFSHD
ncbi:MAG TPA: hypothetical protein VEB42_05380 [Chitinophagaceae bacterium]|nr:hypothetical protein [Chitinophagaceae bacterium]